MATPQPERSSEAGFWHHATVEELAAGQGVKPVADFDSLLGGWPGDADDNLDEWVRALRENTPQEPLD